MTNTVILSNIFENSDFLLSSQLVYKEIFSEGLWQKERSKVHVFLHFADTALKSFCLIGRFIITCKYVTEGKA